MCLPEHFKETNPEQSSDPLATSVAKRMTEMSDT